MISFPRAINTHFFGTSEDRWRGSPGVSFEDRCVNDQTIKIPIFDSEVTDFEVLDSEPRWSHGYPIGELHTARAVLNNRHARNVYFWEVDSSLKDTPIVVSDRAALTTEIDGYPYVRARKLADKGLSTLQIGTEHSDRSERPRRLPVVRTIKGLYSAAALSLDMSIMKTAFEEELVAEKVYQTILGYRPAEIAIGDSQGGMTAAARATYADHLHSGVTKALDIRALCAYEKTSLARAAFWLARELALTPGLVTDMVLNGETERLAKTISTNPELQLGAVLGKIPPLLSGELSKTLAYIDTTTPGQVLRYDSDGISARDADKHWEGFYNINHRSVEGNHLTLGRNRGIDSQVDRLARMGEIILSRGSLKDLSSDEAQYVYRYGSLTKN